MAVAYTTTDVLSTVCEGGSESESRVVDLFREYAEDIDLIVSQITDENMCRFEVCPCDGQFKDTWLSLDQKLLLSFSRTNYVNDRDDDDGSIRLFFQQQRQEFETFE